MSSELKLVWCGGTLLVFFCFLWLCVCLQGQSQVCCLCVDQLSVFVQRQCCRSVLSSRALVRAGAILGSAVMMLLLLFDAVHLRALWRTGWDVGKGKPAPPPPDVAFEWYSEALWRWLVRDDRLFWDTRVLAHSYFTMCTSVSVLCPRSLDIAPPLCIFIHLFIPSDWQQESFVSVSVCPPLSSATKHVYVTALDE